VQSPSFDNCPVLVKFHRRLPTYPQRDHNSVSASRLAGAYARAGEIDKAFEWLEKAYEERDGQDNVIVVPVLLTFAGIGGALYRMVTISFFGLSP
jgi:hypothetical protein